MDDLPSVNLIVRRDIFEKIGGYDSNYYPGEDTKLCLDIVENGKRIIYSPDVLGLFSGPVLSYFIPVLWYFYFAVIVLYLILLVTSIRKAGSFQVWILTFAGIIATHIGYGLMFIRGLCARELLR